MLQGECILGDGVPIKGRPEVDWTHHFASKIQNRLCYCLEPGLDIPDWMNCHGLLRMEDPMVQADTRCRFLANKPSACLSRLWECKLGRSPTTTSKSLGSPRPLTSGQATSRLSSGKSSSEAIPWRINTSQGIFKNHSGTLHTLSQSSSDEPEKRQCIG